MSLDAAKQLSNDDTIQAEYFKVAHSLMWLYFDTAPLAVPSLAPATNRVKISSIVNMMNSGAEFRRMFRPSRSVFEKLVVEMSPWIKVGLPGYGARRFVALSVV